MERCRQSGAHEEQKMAAFGTLRRRRSTRGDNRLGTGLRMSVFL
jgi:hypothetical protein